MHCALVEVVVIPRNGYVNRLQAWASAAILAAQLDVPLRVLWEPEAPAPTPASELFSPALISESFWDRSKVDDLVRGHHESLPRYLSLDTERRLIVLAGHDRGEQTFMEQLFALLSTLDTPATLLIIAGGKFHLPTCEGFSRRRTDFYDRMSWHPELDRRIAVERSARQDYVGLHIRGTDRSIEAPTSRTIREGLGRLRDSCTERSLFVAADTPESRDQWSTIAADFGFAPWSAMSVNHDRAHVGSGRDALVDWRLLGGSSALIYPSSSSFGEEAAVATGNLDGCIGLSASLVRQRVRVAARMGRSAITYPSRMNGRHGLR